MKHLWSMVLAIVVALTIVLPAHGHAADIGDPLLALYDFPGVRASGGVETSIACTNISTGTKIIRVVIRDESGAAVAETIMNLPKFRSVRFSTNETAFSEVIINTPPFNVGVARVFSTTKRIVCTAMILDAVSGSPQGIALHGIRFNPVDNTQE